MTKAVYLAYSNCTEASRDEEFNRWYTHVHIPDLMNTKGLVRARRYRNLKPFEGPSKYLTIYEFDSDDINASIAELQQTATEALFVTGRHIDCFAVSGLLLFGKIDPDSLEPLGEVDYPKELFEG